MTEKIKMCRKCGQEKLVDLFSRDSKKSDLLDVYCKECRKIGRKKYYLENTQHCKDLTKDWKASNSMKDKKNKSNWLNSNKTHITSYHREYIKNRYHSDINYRLTRILRSRLKTALNGNHKSGSAVRDLGCSIEKLRLHLESKFRDDMSWDNYGVLWHIDHILPLASFDLTDPQQLKKACHYTNLQPLLVSENLAKGTRLPA